MTLKVNNSSFKWKKSTFLSLMRSSDNMRETNECQEDKKKKVAYAS